MPVCKNLVYAIIPARSGSVSIKDKNIKKLAGHPLMAYSIGAASLVPEIDRIIVSTDSQAYADVARQYGADVPFLRPTSISANSSTDLEFMIHAIKWFEEHEHIIPEYWVHLRPTTPLRNPSLIQEALSSLKSCGDATSLRSAHKTNHCPFKWFIKNNDGFLETLTGITPDEANGPRQNFPQVYITNGYVDILRTDYILKNHKLHGNYVKLFEVPPVVDIDYESEFVEIEQSIDSCVKSLMCWLDKYN